MNLRGTALRSSPRNSAAGGIRRRRRAPILFATTDVLARIKENDVQQKILIGLAALSLAVIAFVFIARPKPCTGNVMQDDLIACGLKMGDQK